MSAIVETITVGPFGIFFTNKNREMGLPGHSHYGEVAITFLSLGPRGFPSFHNTSEAIVALLSQVTERPIEGTNEHLARMIYTAFDGWTTPEIDAWGGSWTLDSIKLGVQGVRDAIGHAAAMTTYEVRRAPSSA